MTTNVIVMVMLMVQVMVILMTVLMTIDNYDDGDGDGGDGDDGDDDGGGCELCKLDHQELLTKSLALHQRLKYHIFFLSIFVIRFWVVVVSH